MKSQYKILLEDDGGERSLDKPEVWVHAALVVPREFFSHLEAAEVYVERHFADLDYPRHVEVVVTDTESGEFLGVDVEVRSVLEFTASYVDVGKVRAR